MRRIKFILHVTLGIAILMTARPYPESGLTYSNEDMIKQLEQDLNQPQNSAAPQIWHHFRFKKIKSNDVLSAFKTQFPQTTFLSYPNQEGISYLATKEENKNIKELLYIWDKSKPQFKFEVTVIEISYTQFDDYKSSLQTLMNSLHLEWDLKNNIVKTPNPIDVVLANWQSSGNAKLLAKPHITSLLGETAELQFGDRYPYVTSTIEKENVVTQIQYLDTGIDLKVHPIKQTPSGILTQIETHIAAIKLFKDINQIQYPVLSSRKSKSIVELRKDEIFVLAGMLSEEVKNTESKTPFLGNIPVAGRLFKSHTKDTINSDILILIQPITDTGTPSDNERLSGLPLIRADQE